MQALERRGFLKAAGALAAVAVAGGGISGPSVAAMDVKRQAASVKPKRLKRGNTIGIVAPSGITWEKDTLKLALESLAVMGLKAKVFPHAMDRWGYLAGKDADRAADYMAAVRDPEVDAIFCLRGGWGAARILPYLDFEAIRANPKLVMGYSDITALHSAYAAKAGIVTIHGPNAGSAWYVKEAAELEGLAFKAEKLEYSTEPENDGTLVARKGRIQTIASGIAEGRLMGGNLSIVVSLMGTPYAPDYEGAILCIEDVGEAIYRCDRMLTQLALGGVLSKVKGVVLGGFTDCGPGSDDALGGFTLSEVFEQHLAGLGVPVYSGAQFGHIRDNSPLPFGVMARMDADKGTIRLLESAVA